MRRGLQWTNEKANNYEKERSFGKKQRKFCKFITRHAFLILALLKEIKELGDIKISRNKKKMQNCKS